MGYYTSDEFPAVLHRCLQECTDVLGRPEDSARDRDTYNRALVLNREQPNHAVRPLAERLELLFGSMDSPDALNLAFLKPIFATAWLDPCAIDVLRKLRSAGIKTAIVSNTPWGSPAEAWREELGRRWDTIGAQGAGIRPVLLAPTPKDGIAEHLTIRDLRGIIALAQATTQFGLD